MFHIIEHVLLFTVSASLWTSDGVSPIVLLAAWSAIESIPLISVSSSLLLLLSLLLLFLLLTGEYLRDGELPFELSRLSVGEKGAALLRGECFGERGGITSPVFSSTGIEVTCARILDRVSAKVVLPLCCSDCFNLRESSISRCLILE